ncbi:hypothetical protein VKT23_000947 [Stygiomarasmius scandens]|uniref:Uncharacterized protein n=1 Tax=Marasmiellus scandens TaxID=2682957 RepID=A0ABR1K820_9AGAR
MNNLTRHGHPPSSTGPMTYEGAQTVIEAQQLLGRTAQGNREGFEAMRQIQRIVAVVAIDNRDGRRIPPGARFLNENWHRPTWLQDASALHQVYEDDDSSEFEFGSLPNEPQQQNDAPLQDQATWIALYGHPWTHTGVQISSGFLVDLATV